MSISFLLIAALLVAAISVVLYTLKLGISPMPSVGFVRRLLIKAVPPETVGTIVDLGSGWGNLLFPLSRRFPDCQLIGYEQSPLPYLFSSLLGWLLRRQNLSFHRQNFFQVSLSDTSVVLCYLFPHTMRELREKLERELKPGTIVISNTFAIPGWTPLRELQCPDLYATKIFIYQR